MNEHNTHGFEEEENEHDVVDKVYLNIKPRRQHSSLAKELKQQAGKKFNFHCLDSIEWQAADLILDLEDATKSEKEIKDHMWKSLAQVEKQRDELEKENKFLKELINKYHLENDAFSGKGNIK